MRPESTACSQIPYAKVQRIFRLAQGISAGEQRIMRRPERAPERSVLARFFCPVSIVLRSAYRPKKSATSVSTACVSRARAPLRKISLSESVKVPGRASLMTLVSVTAYHSFGREVEALNPHDTPPYPFMPSPTSAHSSELRRRPTCAAPKDNRPTDSSPYRVRSPSSL